MPRATSTISSGAATRFGFYGLPRDGSSIGKLRSAGTA